ncbi:ABC transporter permease [Acidaminobacter sp. JC074]|uniref:ABC transporter permease n=1 Tax=Acidaminobacter sp. JC074 TaxID=2530199 RepID=UPI001F0D5C5A|nr:ABC transporter permease [Acidaminobacter sp. JC074]MCH4887451.1 ABC transporter permease [Acidaminobacter sp. JC074]
MLKYFVKRFLRSVLTLFIVITVVFLLMRLMPEEGYFGEMGTDKLDEAQQEAILKSMGLRDPMHIQLKNFYADLLRGDFGESLIFRPNVPIAEIIKQKIPYSLWFGLFALGLSLVVGISMGIGMARHKGKFFDKLGTSYVVFISAVPAIIYYLFIQIYVTGVLKLPLLFEVEDPKSWIIPGVAMSLGSISGYAMWMRRYMVDELNKDYIKLATAKGLSKKRIMYLHVMRNALVPMVQYLPSSILFTIAGSIYVESLFSIPGMGGLLVSAIQLQDNTLVQALVLIFSSIGIIGLFLGDVLMAIFDPRIKLQKAGGGR